MIDLNTNYPDVLVVIGKILSGKSSRKKSSNQKTEEVFSIASVRIAEFRRWNTENGE